MLDYVVLCWCGTHFIEAWSIELLRAKAEIIPNKIGCVQSPEISLPTVLVEIDIVSMFVNRIGAGTTK